MTMKTKHVSLSKQSAQLSFTGTEDTWTFKGYASVFGSLNDRGFAFAPGAFAEVLASGASPAMFFNHNARSVPIGKWTKLVEDETGLYVEGELSQKVSMAKDVHGALVDGLLDGMSVSIGWYDQDQTELSDGTTVVNKVCELSEISLCTFPADPRARVSEALSADEMDERIAQCGSLKDIEGFLRDAAGLSRRQSKALVSACKNAIAAEDRRRDDDDSVKLAAFDRISKAVANLH